MADYNVLKAAIADYVKDRTGLSTIDGDGLQETLVAMVNSLGVGYQYSGIATPATNPGTPDQNVFYIAAEPGTYTNFVGAGGSLVVADGEVAIFKYNGQWSKDSTDIITEEKIYENIGSLSNNHFILNNYANPDNGGLQSAVGYAVVYKWRLINGATIQFGQNAIGYYISYIVAYDGNGNYLGRRYTNLVERFSFPVSSILGTFPTAKYLSIVLHNQESQHELDESDIADWELLYNNNDSFHSRISYLLGEDYYNHYINGHTWFDGDNNTGSSERHYVYGVSGGHKYRIHVINPDVDMSGVTTTGVRFIVNTEDSEGAPQGALVSINIGQPLANYYDVILPSGAAKIYIGGRCSKGHRLNCYAEDITFDNSEKINQLNERIDALDKKEIVDSAFNLFVEKNNIRWNNAGVVIAANGWSCTPMIEISRIFNVENTGIIIDGRIFGNEDYNIPSAVFFDANKDIISAATIFDTMTSGQGDFIPASHISQYNAKYVAFNTYVEYYKYLSIKGLGLSGINRVLGDVSANIDSLNINVESEQDYYEKLFCEENPDKFLSIDDYISNPTKTSNGAKELYYKLMQLRKNGYNLWGQQDDFIRVLHLDGSMDVCSPENSFYCEKVGGQWIPKQSIDLNGHCNTYLRGGKLPSLAGIDLSYYIYYYRLGNAEGAAFWKETITTLVKEYYKQTGGVIHFTFHCDNPYGGNYDVIDPTYPDAFAQILAENPADGGVAKQCFDDIVFCLKDILLNIKDDNNNPIPVILRPFHERYEITTGYVGFWWNRSTDAEYAEVFRMLVDEIREDCYNALFVFNPNPGSFTATISKADLLKGYPGDNYIDLIGIDIYDERISALGGWNNLEMLISQINTIVLSLNKIPIIPEIGSLNGATVDFFDMLQKFVNRIGVVPMFMTWNNQGTNYWFTPYNENTEYFRSYVRFLSRNRIYLPQNS